MFNIKKIFASNIRRIRKNLNLTQEQFAELIKVQPRTVANFEYARNLPKPECMEKICSICNIAPFELFLEDNEILNKNIKFKKILSILKNIDENNFNLICDIAETIHKRNKQ